MAQSTTMTDPHALAVEQAEVVVCKALEWIGVKPLPPLETTFGQLNIDDHEALTFLEFIRRQYGALHLLERCQEQYRLPKDRDPIRMRDVVSAIADELTVG